MSYPIATAVHRATMQLLNVPNPEELDPAVFLATTDFSHVEGVPKYYWKIENEQLVEMTETEKDAVDIAKRPAILEKKLADIDRKTKEVVERGFQHDGQTFSLSQEAQANWTRIKIIQLSGTLVFPVTVSTMNSDLYDIVDEPSMLAFFTALDTAIVTALAQGRALREQVKLIEHCNDIEAWVDPRS